MPSMQNMNTEWVFTDIKKLFIITILAYVFKKLF